MHHALLRVSKAPGSRYDITDMPHDLVSALDTMYAAGLRRNQRRVPPEHWSRVDIPVVTMLDWIANQGGAEWKFSAMSTSSADETFLYTRED